MELQDLPSPVDIQGDAPAHSEHHEDDVAVISVGDPNLLKDLLITLGDIHDQLSEWGQRQLYDNIVNTDHLIDDDPSRLLHPSDDKAVLTCLIGAYTEYESKINAVIPPQLLKDAEKFIAVMPQMGQRSHNRVDLREMIQKKMSFIWGQCGHSVKQSVRNILMEEIKKQDLELLVKIEKYMKHLGDHLPLKFEMMLLGRIHQKYRTQMKAFHQCERILSKIRDRRRRYVMAFAELAHDDAITECLPTINSCRTTVNDAIVTRITNLEARTNEMKQALTGYQRYFTDLSENPNQMIEPNRPYICNICSTNQISHVAQCGHFMCEPCMASISENNYDRRIRTIVGSPCPYCQTPIQSVIRVYF